MFTTISARDYFEMQYALRKSLPSFAADVAEWEALSADRCFAGYHVQVEQYGEHPRQTLELFKPAPSQPGKGLAVFIHGGFWRAMQREQSRFMATPFLKRGYDCAVIEYRLMPEFRLRDLVADTVAALRHLEAGADRLKLGGRMLIAGHSAGAHLALYATCEALKQVTAPFAGASLLLLSGVFDIFAVQHTSIGAETAITPEEVAEWSVFSGSVSLAGRKALFVAGGAETDDFKRQSLVGAQLLCEPGADEVVMVDGANHLTLLTEFARNDALCDALLARL
jgi:arylformamidase